VLTKQHTFASDIAHPHCVWTTGHSHVTAGHGHVIFWVDASAELSYYSSEPLCLVRLLIRTSTVVRFQPKSGFLSASEPVYTSPDIYGDEDLNEYSEQPEGGVQFLDEDSTVVEADAEKQEVNTDTNSETGLEPEARTTAVSVADTHSSLPAKPSSTPNLSYSAQVAKQFSAYQQTPSQERQQRTEIPLPPNPRTNSSRSSYVVPITGPPVTTTSGGTVFGKKPSEMHDAG